MLAMYISGNKKCQIFRFCAYYMNSSTLSVILCADYMNMSRASQRPLFDMAFEQFEVDTFN